MSGTAGRSQRWEAYPFGGLFVLSLFAFFLPGPDLPSGPPVPDKVGHAVIFLLLALSGRFAGYRAGRLLAGLGGYAVVSEVLQAVLPIRRDGDWHDVVADSVGIVAGLLVVLLGSAALRRARPADTCPSRPPASARSSPPGRP